MSTTNKVPVAANPGVQNILQAILELLGVTNVSIDDARMRLTLETDQSGQNIFVRAQNLGGGNSIPPIEKMISATTTPSSGVKATLASGAATVTMANKAGDLIVARMVTSGGTPGAGYLCVGNGSTNVAVKSETAAGALQTLDTSVIEVYNFGNPAS